MIASDGNVFDQQESKYHIFLTISQQHIIRLIRKMTYYDIGNYPITERFSIREANVFLNISQRIKHYCLVETTIRN